MNRFVERATIAAGLIGVAAAASAQVVPPIEDVVIQGEILNRSASQAIGQGSAKTSASADELEGEAGIYVLTLNDIFFVSGSAGLGHASNPTRTALDSGEDWYGDIGGSLGVSTRLGGALDFGASLNVDARDYVDQDLASSRSVSTVASIGAPVFGPLYASAVAFGGYAYDRNFDGQTAFYGLAANASAAFPLTRKLLVRPGIGLTQQWSDVSENNSFTAIASVDAVYRLAPRWLVSGRISVSERKYEDFYEDVTFVEREDTSVGVAASMVWKVSRNSSLAISASYEDQDSSFFLSSFDTLDTGLAVSLKKAF